ncbi:MAG: flagellar motor protein MotB [Gammaproteobacteria bacterium]|nr:MAG: flagellar motor protein MotB [Gammaproteobacteria bacterium]TND02614.1 MAG: flagellar motor protein MotB [Gammaproteobacteria bacterium]
MNRTSLDSYQGIHHRNSAFHPVAAPHDAQESDGWLISFVDILTLLVTLFVVLLAFSQYSGQVKTASKVKAEKHVMAGTTATQQNDTPPARELIDDLTIPPDLQHQLEITRTATSVNFEIKDSVLFDTASADLKPAGRTILARIAGVLDKSRYQISVEGHTDNAPIHTARFPSNWELSTLRATTVTRYLIEQGITTERLRATGYADTQPLAVNTDDTGRARNRRVSLVVNLNDPVKQF